MTQFTNWINAGYTVVATTDGDPSIYGVSVIDDGSFDSDIFGFTDYTDTSADTCGLFASASNGGVYSDQTVTLTAYDSNGNPDHLDTDSDNDGVLDSVESGFTLSGIYGSNGLDS